MTNYIERLDAAGDADKWPMLRGWLYSEPLPLFAELREKRPIVSLPELDFVTRHSDCTMILRRHDSFSVELYKPKQGDFFMAQDDTAEHWREKSVMKSILDFEDVPKMRDWVAKETAKRLDDARGSIELVRNISRGIPVGLVQKFFGFRNADEDKLIQWSYWNQQDAFHNQFFDAPGPVSAEEIIKNRKKAGISMGFYLGRLLARRSLGKAVGLQGADPMSRLLRLSSTEALKFGLKDVLFNTGGLLIGTVETTSHCVINALEFLMEDEDRFADAKNAAAKGTEKFDGYVMEALRFHPAFPYYFRTCKRDTPLSADRDQGMTVKEGRTVLAVTHSAMFDETAFPNPTTFDPTRDLSDIFTFGQGLHECLGRAIAAAMLPEIVRQVIQLPDLKPLSKPDYEKTKVPQKWQMEWSDGRK